MPKISIIVPVYKAEKYLCHCIDSILNQTFTDFELILVDDGSPDNCGTICDEYAKRDSRIKVIHKPNGGVSSARNAGMHMAKGTYLMFCDSDDAVDPGWCELHHQMIERHPNAWVVSNIAKIGENGERISAGSGNQANDQPCTYFDVYKSGLSPYLFNKIFRSDIIRDCQIRLDESVFLGEDIGFNIAYYKQCSEICRIYEELYCYYDTPNAATKKYYWNQLELNLPHFAARRPLIQKHELGEFCDIYLFSFLNWLDNSMDSRNPMTWCKKMHYNHQMMNTEEFRYCVANASGKNDSRLFMRIVRLHNYYIYWLFQKACFVKSKLSGK